MAQIYSSDDHDTIIRKFADQILKNNPDQFKAIVNLPEEKTIELAGIVPDILLVDPTNDKPQVAIEVETAETLTENHAETRWKPISTSVPRFQVVLPKGTVNRAKRYCKKLGIKAAFHEV